MFCAYIEGSSLVEVWGIKEGCTVEMNSREEICRGCLGHVPTRLARGECELKPMSYTSTWRPKTTSASVPPLEKRTVATIQGLTDVAGGFLARLNLMGRCGLPSCCNADCQLCQWRMERICFWRTELPATPHSCCL